MSAACRRFESARSGPELCEAPNVDCIRAVLVDTREHDDAGNDFSDMWTSESMDFFAESLFADYDLCADLLKLIGQNADKFPLLGAALDRLAESLAEEL